MNSTLDSIYIFTLYGMGGSQSVHNLHNIYGLLSLIATRMSVPGAGHNHESVTEVQQIKREMNDHVKAFDIS